MWLVKAVQVLTSDETCPELEIVDAGGTARAVLWPGVGALHRSIHVLTLAEASATQVLCHPSDAVYYVSSGSAHVHDQSVGISTEVGVGSMFHVDAGTSYSVVSTSSDTVIIGGPCPPDESLYEYLRY